MLICSEESANPFFLSFVQANPIIFWLCSIFGPLPHLFTSKKKKKASVLRLQPHKERECHNVKCSAHFTGHQFLQLCKACCEQAKVDRLPVTLGSTGVNG
jgi:hypothetical protein